LGIISSILLIIPVITLIYFPPDSFSSFLIRLCALWGFIGLTLGSIINLNKKILYQKFGLKFLKTHHTIALFALINASLHPIVFALSISNIKVFLPDFSSWYNFWLLGGRPALILIYIAVIAAIFRKKSKKFWKYLHYLMYVALILILVHGIMIGTDFNSWLIIIVFSLLTAGSIVTFILLRLQKRKIKLKSKQKSM
jgi:methionine sulfoxide reductase heme-binding subunit